MPITSIAKDLYQLPHVSGEDVKASAGAIEMSCFLGQGKLKPILQMADKPVPEIQGEKIVTANSKLSIAHFATPVNNLWNEFGGIDQIITLFSPPQSNTLIFDYDSTNLVPYHQPPLTAEEIARGTVRPDHAVNSLAWYHISKGGLVSLSDVASRITTGKAQHWYRQVVTDALGKKSWADWLILNGSQVGLVLDDKFMATAVYPITIAPVGDTFGYESNGATSDWLDINEAHGSLFTSPAGGGTGVRISVYGRDAGDNVKGLLVLHSTLAIVTNGIGGAVALAATASWKDSAFASAPTIASSTEYILAVVLGGASQVLYWDAGAANQGHRDPYNSYTTPTTLADIVHGTVKYSIHCDYTPAGGNTYTESTLVKAGNKVTASRAWTLPRATLTKSGSKTIASRALTFARSALIKAGSIIVGDVGQTLNYSTLVKAGSLVTGSRALVFARAAAIKSGSKIIAGRAWAFSQSALVKAGSKILAARTWAFSRTALLKSGSKTIASRAVTIGRSALVKSGSKITASRVWTLTRSAIVKTGSKIIASVQHITGGVVYNFSALVKSGSKVTGSRLLTWARSALIKSGSKVTASRVWALARSTLVKSGSRVTGSRLLIWARSALVKSGSLVTASRVWALARSTLVKSGSRVTGIVVRGFARILSIVSTLLTALRITSATATGLTITSDIGTAHIITSSIAAVMVITSSIDTALRITSTLEAH